MRWWFVILVACSGSTAAPPRPAIKPPFSPPVDATIVSLDLACKTADDCKWTEVTREILTEQDCLCLHCWGTVVNKQTSDRRYQAFRKLCDPKWLPDGRPCSISHCIKAPALTCVAGECRSTM